MAKTSCYARTPPIVAPRGSGCGPKPIHSVPSFATEKSRPGQGCRTTSAIDGSNTISSAAHNLTFDELIERLEPLGPLDEQPCYTYVIRTIGLQNGRLVQTASAPNFSGEHITLCTCKHGTRALRTPKEWKGVWVAGMHSWDQKFSKRQALVFLMRVAEAYDSHFELIEAFRASGRAAVVEAKNSMLHQNGDLMMPRKAVLAAAERLDVSAYFPPMIEHAHRHTTDDMCWHNDIHHIARNGQFPALLVGDPAYSFTWSKQMVENTTPGSLRPHRTWDLRDLMGRLTAFQA